MAGIPVIVYNVLLNTVSLASSPTALGPVPWKNRSEKAKWQVLKM